MDNKKMKKVLLYFLFIDVRTAMQIYTNFYVLINHNKKGVCCSQTAQRVAMKRCLPAMASKYNKTYCTSHCFLTKKQFTRRCHSRSSCRMRMRGRCCCRPAEREDALRVRHCFSQSFFLQNSGTRKSRFKTGSALVCCDRSKNPLPRHHRQKS
jgi:hypothetical protein